MRADELSQGGFRDCARNDEAMPIVHHDKSRWQLDSRQARRPAGVPAAGIVAAPLRQNSCRPDTNTLGRR